LWTEDSSFLTNNNDDGTYENIPRTYSEDSEFTVLSPTRGEFLLEENEEIENSNLNFEEKYYNNVCQ
jgi:hypothetical protein